MDYIQEILENVVRSLAELKKSYISELSDCISGSLINNLSHKQNRFYHAQNSNGKYKRKYLSPQRADDRNTIGKLARKEYLKKSLPALDKNIATLTKALNNYSSIDPGSIIKEWKNIIYIYATDNSFDVGYIESIIKYQILPRL